MRKTDHRLDLPRPSFDRPGTGMNDPLLASSCTHQVIIVYALFGERMFTGLFCQFFVLFQVGKCVQAFLPHELSVCLDQVDYRLELVYVGLQKLTYWLPFGSLSHWAFPQSSNHILSYYSAHSGVFDGSVSRGTGVYKAGNLKASMLILSSKTHTAFLIKQKRAGKFMIIETSPAVG